MRQALELTAMVIAALALAVMASHFQWSVVWHSLPFLLQGLRVSWMLAIVSMALGLIGGIGLAAARVYGPWWLRVPVTAAIELVRAIPQLMLIFWVFFSYPALTGGHSLSPWSASLISLTVIAAAYSAEVIRAGIKSVPRLQREAAFASGLSGSQGLRHVILPQALRNMMPALVATFVMMFKVTSLVYVTGLVEFFRATIIVNNRDYAPGALYTTMALGYLVCCGFMSWLIRRLDPRYVVTD
jgi:His/Glu/Gln/Arg/opine family amino acid ABC transporter permease subunit